ncbi:MAG: phosphoglycerate dehydrogenase [Ignavibacteriae bacterium]|nr:phosphoglycerate dehydrogenase [Ignavibacteriota bacterium]
MKVLISEPIEEKCVEILKSEGFEVDFKPTMTAEELKQSIGNYSALVVRSATKVTADVLANASNMKVIGRAGTGVDNIDINAATRKGIIVLNVPGGNTVSTAEHTISLLMAMARNIPQAHQSMREGKWERKKYVGVELCGKTLGVVGLGKVGKEVARRCLGFEMKVIAFDPVLAPEVAAKMGFELVDLDQLLRRSDFITVHTPLTNETRNLIDVRALAMCKKGVRFVNCARGGIINEQALLDALNVGIVAGAALDVYEKEPPTESPLVKHPHVVVTPHLGASTEDAQEKVAVEIARQVADVLKGKDIVGSVNADIFRQAMRVELHPYLTLAEKMGKLTAQLMQGKLYTLKLQTNGTMLSESSTALTAAMLKGLLETMLDEPVNYLNAPLIAKERGLNVNLSREEDHEVYNQLLTVSYETDKEKRSFAGTVFGKNIRIVKMDGFYFEIKPEGHLLIYYNEDKPGMLAAVGSILAGASINIAGVSLGRFEQGKQALTIMSIDSPVSQVVMNQIAGVDGVVGVKMVSL